MIFVSYCIFATYSHEFLVSNKGHKVVCQNPLCLKSSKVVNKKPFIFYFCEHAFPISIHHLPDSLSLSLKSFSMEELETPANNGADLITFSDDFDSTCSTPFVSAPSSPGRGTPSYDSTL